MSSCFLVEYFISKFVSQMANIISPNESVKLNTVIRDILEYMKNQSTFQQNEYKVIPFTAFLKSEPFQFRDRNNRLNLVTINSA